MARRPDAVVTIGGDLSQFHRSVGQGLNSFAKGANQARERALVFGRALASLGDVGGQTGAILGNVLGGLAMGGTLGLALGGVNALIAVVANSGKEAKEAAQQHESAGKQIGESYKRSKDEIAVMVAELRGGAVAAAQMRAQLAIADAEEGIRKQQKALEDAKKAQTDYNQGWVRTESGIKQYADNVKAAEANVAAARAAAGAVMAAEALKLNEVVVATETKAQDERVKAHEAATADILRMERELTEILDGEAKERERLDLLRLKAEQKAREDASKAFLAQVKADSDAWVAENKKYEDQLKATADVYAQWGNVAVGAMQDVITGQKTAGEAAAAVAQQVLNAIVQMLMQKAATAIATHTVERPTNIAEATAAAGVAGAEGAAAVAGIPIVGPALAASVAASLPSTIMGLTVPLASAAGGMKVPHDMLAMIHEDERVLPAKYSKGLDRLVADAERGRGGDTYVSNYYAISMREFARHQKKAEKMNRRDRRKA